MDEAICLTCDQTDGICGHTGKCRDCAGECLKCDGQHVDYYGVFLNKKLIFTIGLCSKEKADEHIAYLTNITSNTHNKWTVESHDEMYKTDE